MNRLALCAVAFSLLAPPAAADDSKAAWAALAKGGHVALIRHGTAPGNFDPPGMKIDDCKTQRNMDEAGREESRTLGAAFRKSGVRVGRVLSSPMCRCLETARLMDVGPVESSLSLLPDRDKTRPVRLGELRELVSSWRGPETLVLVTHGFSVQDLLGFIPSSAETIVVRPKRGSKTGGDLVGRIPALK